MERGFFTEGANSSWRKKTRPCASNGKFFVVFGTHTCWAYTLAPITTPEKTSWSIHMGSNRGPYILRVSRVSWVIAKQAVDHLSLLKRDLAVGAACSISFSVTKSVASLLQGQFNKIILPLCARHIVPGLELGGLCLMVLTTQGTKLIGVKSKRRSLRILSVCECHTPWVLLSDVCLLVGF